MSDDKDDYIDMGNAKCPSCGRPVSACGGKCLPKEEPQYPLHTKLKAHKLERRGMQRMLDWLQANGYSICESSGSEVHPYWPTGKRPDELIGGAIGVDPMGLEEEKQQMLDLIRAQQP